MTVSRRPRAVRTGLAVTAVVALAAACSSAKGSESSDGSFKPSKVTMIVAASPGGGSDLMGRTVASGLEQVGESVNVTVENHPGGSTAVGYSHLLKQKGKPDFLVAAETTLSALPLATKTPYTWNDFTPIAQIAEDALIVAVKADSPYQTLADLAEATAKKKLSAGIVAAVGPDAVLLDLLSRAQDAVYEPVVFESAGESNTALLAGNIDFLINNPGESKAYVESKDMRFLAVFTEERLTDELLADVPTAQEQDVDVTFGQWRGVLAPGGIDDAAAEYWRDAISKWAETDSYKDYIKKNDLLPVLRAGDEFASYLTDYEKVLSTSIKGSS
jgi:putative tricarboxylic transport membrane protein